MKKRTSKRALSAAAALLTFFSLGTGTALAQNNLPGKPSGIQDGQRGQDYTQNEEDLPEVLTQEEIDKIRQQQQRERDLENYKQYLDRLKDLGVGSNGGSGGGSSSSGSSGGVGGMTSDGKGGATTNLPTGGTDKPVNGAGKNGVPENAGVGAPNPIAWKAVQVAADLTNSGKKYPYAWGGSSPQTSFDCSGFTGWTYNEAGLSLPSVAQSQDLAAKNPHAGVRKDAGDTSKKLLELKDQKDLLPGDLLVWKGGEAGGHVGIILTKGGEGPHAFQESGDPNQMGSFRKTNVAGQSFQMIRPTVLADGSPVIPEAKPFSNTSSTSASEDMRKENNKDNEKDSNRSSKSPSARKEDE